jgi:hypothetical protein
VYAYASIDDLKGTMALNIEGTISDTRLRQLVEAVSTEVRNYVKRDIHPINETRYFDGSGGSSLNVSNMVSLGATALSESTLLNGTWSKVWGGSGTSWIGEPYNANPTSADNMSIGPYRFVTVNAHSNNTTVDSFETGQRRFKLDGVWGWSNVSVSFGGAASASFDATATALTNTGSLPQVGWTLAHGTEQMYVENVVGTVVTLERGANGFTAGVIASGSAWNRLQYPSPIREAVIMQAGRLLKRAQGGFVQEAGIPEGGALVPLMPEGLDRDVKQMIGPFRMRITS